LKKSFHEHQATYKTINGDLVRSPLIVLIILYLYQKLEVEISVILDFSLLHQVVDEE
jgi:hypothetical protein